jgi:hypothetical protein
MTEIADMVKDKIIRLLAQGIAGSTVAAVVGIEPSYISQLMMDNDFANQVNELKLIRLQEHTARDDRINKLEDKAIAMVEKDMENPFVYPKGLDRLRALTMVNNLKRRGVQGDNNTGQVNNTYVTINLPTHVKERFVNAGSFDNMLVNGNNEVLVAGEQELITMQSGTLKKLNIGENGGENGSSDGQISNSDESKESGGKGKATRKLPDFSAID